MKRTDEATWKESFSINYRALGLWRKMAGRFLLALTLSTALEALAPYIPLVLPRGCWMRSQERATLRD